MLLIKILINLFPALLLTLCVYILFYFDIIPALLRHWRKALNTERKYGKEIDDIKKDPEND